ncbi:MAG: hypothetical protein AB1461_00755 [Thermodesulfobacteriota bacterium]
MGIGKQRAGLPALLSVVIFQKGSHMAASCQTRPAAKAARRLFAVVLNAVVGGPGIQLKQIF